MLEEMSSARGVVGNFLVPGAIECVASEQQQQQWPNSPKFPAPMNVEMSNGRVAQFFGLSHSVERAVWWYTILSSGLQRVPLPLGSRVIEQLQGKEYAQDCHKTKVMSAVMSARQLATGPVGPVAHRPMLWD